MLKKVIKIINYLTKCKLYASTIHTQYTTYIHKYMLTYVHTYVCV